MAKPRKRNAAPLTVSRPALLVDGSDAEFRGLIHDLIAYGHRLDACRDAFAAIAGVSPAQYEILMLVSRADGAAGGRGGRAPAPLGRLHHHRGQQAGRARHAGEGRRSRPTGAGCCCSTTAKARAILERLAPYQVRINDVLFEQLDAKRFRELRALAARAGRLAATARWRCSSS